jgi:1-phosphofructokinase family hexose kinase
MILTVTLNPCVDKTIFIKNLEIGRVIRAEGVKLIAGGSGNNVARVVRSLGHPVLALNLLGGGYGDIIATFLRSEGIPFEAAHIKGSSRTVVTVLDTASGIQTAYVEPGPEVSPEEVAHFKGRYKRVLKDAQLVVLSGSVPCPSLNDLYADLIGMAKDRGLRVILDTRGPALPQGVASSPFMVKPNVEEMGDILGRRIVCEEDVLECLNLCRERGVELIALSFGREGILVSYRGGLFRAWPPQIKVVNPIGSGDSLVAGFAVGIVRDMAIEDTIRLGVAAGAANAAIWDAASCTKEEIWKLVPGVRLEKAKEADISGLLPNLPVEAL